MKSSYLSTLIQLLLLGAKTPIELSTYNLAKSIDKTQQTASQHLLFLEKNNLIFRYKIDGNDVIKISDSGLDYLKSVNQQITSAFDDNIPSILSGTLFSGLGEGAYYISLSGYKKQFISKLGFEPYPGTLNLKISDVIHKQFFDKLSKNDGILIEGFTDKKRTYGNVKCFPCTINSNIQGSIIVIERTHHDRSVIELISPIFLRKKLKLNDGDEVSVKVDI
tara:strand:- start:1076 stop:1738 length:663 start_codon:yes stop_codon:yes gene_type:complete